MSFDTSFISMLEQFGKLPKTNSIAKCLQMEQDNEELKRDNFATKLEITELKQLLEQLCTADEGLREKVEKI